MEVSKKLGQDSVFIIAEAGSNWRVGSDAHSLQMGCTLIDIAKNAGCDAVKFQLFRPEMFAAYYSGEPIASDYCLPDEYLRKFAEHAEKRGIICFASAFSLRDFKVCDELFAIHKIASYELGHIRLIEACAKSGKPTIMSTGAADIHQIHEALGLFLFAGGKESNLYIMQCTAAYPTEPNDLNLNVLTAFYDDHNAYKFFSIGGIGLSDHSLHPIFAPVAAVALGARIIEKHFTLSRRQLGPDHEHALEPNELQAMVEAIRHTERMLGSDFKSVLPAEKRLYQTACRAIHATRDIAIGEIFREGVNIDILRPGTHTKGVHPRNLPRINGQASYRNIPAGDGIQPLDFGDLPSEIKWE